MPIIESIVGSKIYGFGSLVPTSFDSIASYQVTAATQSELDFSNIPSTYEHLQLRIFCKSPRSDIAISFNSILAQFNGDVATNYYQHYIYGNSASVSTDRASYNYLNLGAMPGSIAGETDYFTYSITDIIDYKNTNKYKTVKSIWGYATPSSITNVGLVSNVWLNTNAVNRVNVRFDGYANGFKQYSNIALYGIKGV